MDQGQAIRCPGRVRSSPQRGRRDLPGRARQANCISRVHSRSKSGLVLSEAKGWIAGQEGTNPGILPRACHSGSHQHPLTPSPLPPSPGEDIQVTHPRASPTSHLPSEQPGPSEQPYPGSCGCHPAECSQLGRSRSTCQAGSHTHVGRGTQRSCTRPYLGETSYTCYL